MPAKLFVAAALSMLLSSAGAWAQDKAMTIKLMAQNGSNQNGTATLTPKGGKTEITIQLAGGPQGTAQPAHIHAGTCAKLDPKPKLPLQNVVGGTSTTVLDMPLKQVVEGGGAINVHKSTEDLKTYVACGGLNVKVSETIARSPTGSARDSSPRRD